MGVGKGRSAWRSPWVLGGGGAALAVVAALAGSLMAVLGAELACVGGGSSSATAPATRAAEREIPSARLRLYQEAGRRFDLDWAFLASIGTQECGTGTCAHVYPSGCGGPMQIAIVRESACSPGPGPTIWETYGVDADGNGQANPFDLADAIFTAARLLRRVMGAPPSGSSYAAYREAACNYYGACADAAVNYADEVMARAVEYGFHGADSPAPSDPAEEEPATEGSSCGGSALPSGAGPMGPVRKASAPRHLARLPEAVSAGPGIECDARIVPDVVYLARRFGVIVTACFAASGHDPSGEHPLGAAIDAVPRDGNWNRTMRLAVALGWRPSCAVSGVAPACAHPPFRWIGYNGYPDHGDPLHCVPCGGGPHLHLSWLTSASEGQSENRLRYGYEPASWIEVFDPAPVTSDSASGEGR